MMNNDVIAYHEYLLTPLTLAAKLLLFGSSEDVEKYPQLSSSFSMKMKLFVEKYSQLFSGGKLNLPFHFLRKFVDG